MSIFINVSSKWVKTDVKYYASRQDVIDYMEHLYPTKFDTKRGKKVQNYDIDTLKNGDHRVWADRKLTDQEIEWLEDVNNDGKTFR